MEDLRPSQLILLSILVTFVTSIATTVVSLSLLADTPLSITQVINRVVHEPAIAEAEQEALRVAILAEVDQRLVGLADPEVAGAYSVGPEFLSMLLAAAPQPDSLGRLWIDPWSYMAPKTMADTIDTDAVPVGDLLLVGPDDVARIEVGAPIEVGDGLYVVNPRLSTITPAEVLTIRTEAAGKWMLNLAEVEACQQVGAWVVASDATPRAVCIGEGLVFLGARLRLDEGEPGAIDHETQQQEEYRTE